MGAIKKAARTGERLSHAVASSVHRTERPLRNVLELQSLFPEIREETDLTDGAERASAQLDPDEPF